MYHLIIFISKFVNQTFNFVVAPGRCEADKEYFFGNCLARYILKFITYFFILQHHKLFQSINENSIRNENKTFIMKCIAGATNLVLILVKKL